jgi:hypothetical protein
VSLDSSDPLVSALVLPHPPEGEDLPETYLTLVTRGGRIKRVTRGDFAAASRGTVSAMNVEEGDQLVWVVETTGQDDVLLATRQGKAIRFPEEEVRSMGLSAAGVLAIKLGKDDAVVGMGIAQDDAFVILLSEDGYAKRTPIKSYPTQKRYGGGVQAVKLHSRTGKVAVAAVAAEPDDVVLTTEKGRVTKLSVKAIHSLGRAASGYKSRQDTKDPYVEQDKHGPPALLTVLAGTKTAAKRARARRDTEKPTAKKASSRATSREAVTKPASKSRKQTTSSAKSQAISRSKKQATSASGPTKSKKTSRSSSRSTKSKATDTQEGTPTQQPLPLQSAPAKPGSSKSRRKTTTRKSKTVRSVPKS